MRKIIKHKIRKGSVFQVINDPKSRSYSRDYYVFVFLTGKSSNKKMEKDIVNFVVDNQNEYGQYVMMHDYIDTKLAPSMLDRSHPCLMDIKTDNAKRFNKEMTDAFWREVELLVMSHRTLQRTIIITTSDLPSPKIQQNADYIFAPKNMRLNKDRWIYANIIRY